MPDLSKTFSIHSSSSSLYSLFFLSDLLCRAMRWLHFLARVPITSSFFRGLDGCDISVFSTLWLKICFFEIPEDVVDVLAEVEVAAMTCNCYIIFFKRYSLTRAASFFLNTSYFFGSIYLLLSLSVFFFLRHQSLYRNHPSYLDKLNSNLCCFFFYHFQQLLVNTLLANLLTNY